MGTDGVHEHALMQFTSSSTLHELSPLGIRASCQCVYSILSRAPRHLSALAEPALCGALTGLLHEAQLRSIEQWYIGLK